MSTYAIGDIQGCYVPLLKLLEHIQFDPSKDTLWFTGDLVNRGPQSLDTLRFIKKIEKNVHIALGNHDLHLLAMSHGAHPGWEEDNIKEILIAPDCDELLHWLSHQPLLIHDKKLGYTMTHAGLAPMWDLTTAQRLAREIETIIQSEDAKEFFENMYGNEPALWNENLSGWDRARCITNYFTRMRFCYPDGSLELKNKGKVDQAHDLIPWYQAPHRVNADLKIIFGHWAALGGVTNTPNVFALDTGCFWGYCLTAMRLEDQKRFSVDCHND